MKVAELIEKRQPSWQELENLCSQMATISRSRDPELVARFSELYRAACADLALAEAYQLPPKTVEYLHQLVARAHNQMYRSQTFQWRKWQKQIFEDTPQVIFNDRCVHFSFIIFWLLFLVSGYLSYQQDVWPDFATDVVGQKQLDAMAEMYDQDLGGRSVGGNSQMMGFYIYNNAGIGMQCFVSMLFVPFGLVTLCYNAVHLGAIFGFMFRPGMGGASLHFKEFVTAHGPLELTAIVLSAGAGMKIGLSWITTNGMSRADSLLKTSREALPIALCAVALFCMAAFVEGFISPMAIPWWSKGAVAVITSCGLMVYFVCFGFPRRQIDEGQMF